MKTNLILRAILFWYTAVVLVLTIASIDSIVEGGFKYLIVAFIVNIGLITICKVSITTDELYIISGTKWLLNRLK